MYGARSQGLMWVNRKRVGPMLACGPYSPRSEYAIPVHLDKGTLVSDADATAH